MPSLTKTTIVPPGNADAVLAQPILKMVVIVNDPSIAQTADDLAQLPPLVDRQVIWFQGGLPAKYQKQFKMSNTTNMLAFALSISNVVKDVIKSGETVDNYRMDSSYTNAGL